MLRNIFVLTIAAIGVYYALHGALYGLLFYLWIAYFRPEQWVWSDFVQNLNLSLLAGVYVVIAAVFSGARFRFNLRIVAMFLFLLHCFLSTLFSEHFDYSMLYWRDFLKSTVISYLIVVLVDDVKKLRLVLLAITLSLGFEATKQGWV